VKKVISSKDIRRHSKKDNLLEEENIMKSELNRILSSKKESHFGKEIGNCLNKENTVKFKKSFFSEKENCYM
jgi:hypothetical protein